MEAGVSNSKLQRRGINSGDGDNAEIHDDNGNSSSEEDTDDRDPNDKGIMKRLTFKYAF